MCTNDGRRVELIMMMNGGINRRSSPLQLFFALIVLSVLILLYQTLPSAVSMPVLSLHARLHPNSPAGRRLGSPSRPGILQGRKGKNREANTASSSRSMGTKRTDTSEVVRHPRPSHADDNVPPLPPVPKFVAERGYYKEVVLGRTHKEERRIRMHYYDSHPRGRLANGEKPLRTVVFIPGFMGKGGDLAAVVQHLLRLVPTYLDNHRTIIVELPGRGKSQDPLSMWEYNRLSQKELNKIAKDFLSIEQMKSAVEQLMDQIIPITGGSSPSRHDVVVVGESMGGHIATLLVAGDKSTSPGGALLVNPYNVASRKKTKGQLAFIEKGENWLAPKTPREFVKLIRAAFSSKFLAKMKTQSSLFARIMSFLEINAGNRWLKALWPLLHWPLLGSQKKRMAYMAGALESKELTADSFKKDIPEGKKIVALLGEEDGIFHPNSRITIRGRKEAEVHIIKKAGHSLFKERPDVVAKYLLSLILRRGSQGNNAIEGH